MARDYTSSLKSQNPAWAYAPLVKGQALPHGPCRGLLVGTAGTANLTDGDGTDRDNVPLQPGYNPLVVKALRAGGTASDIWGLY